jgi:hypothetical protein
MLSEGRQKERRKRRSASIDVLGWRLVEDYKKVGAWRQEMRRRIRSVRVEN